MTDAASRHVLIVDDEAHILQVLSLKLRNAGYIVVTASDGEEALEIVQQGLRNQESGGLPDLIITDFQMPYMTGLELCRALGQRAETAQVPVIMLTARGYTLANEDFGGNPPRCMLSKPFSPRAVVDEVGAILNGLSDIGNQVSEAGDASADHAMPDEAPDAFPRRAA